MTITRRQLLQRSGAAALATPGIYALLGDLAALPARAATGGSPFAEQHLLDGGSSVTDNGVEVLIPPLHHQIVTANVSTGRGAGALRNAQSRLEQALSAIEARYPTTAAGLGITVAWGLPYFRRYVSGPAGNLLPVDQRASAAAGSQQLAVLDAVRFASDPSATILESNDVAIRFVSDSLDHISDASDSLQGAVGDLFDLTSIRRGFVGGGFGGGRSLPKQMATAAGIAGADSIPETAELFMGFTSTQKAALGPTFIANLESLPGLTDQFPGGYFAHGTTMHLSHMYLDLASWYAGPFGSRVANTFSPRIANKVDPGTQTVPEGIRQVEDLSDNAKDARRYGNVGHSSSLQPVSRLAADTTDNYGNFYPAGTAVPQRADFDTLDNPFAWSSRPGTDGWSSDPAAGLHFAVFAPTTDAFHRTRRAMDGQYPDGTQLPVDPRRAGFNAVLNTTHRQNFLVPPRAHRSFPLAELL